MLEFCPLHAICAGYKQIHPHLWRLHLFYLLEPNALPLLQA